MFRFLKPFLSKGLRRSLRLVRYEFTLQKLHRASVRRAKPYADQTGLKLNLGCGALPKSGWINIDRLPQADLQLDLREALPFSDSSVSVIYTEHFLEHLRYPKETGHFLRECRRVLEPGGRLEVGVPDTQWPLEAYSDDKQGYFRLARERFHPPWCVTKMHHLNFHFRQGEEHQYAYDEETLADVLSKQGFVGICRRPFDPQLDSLSRCVGTLYMRAYRPPRP